MNWLLLRGLARDSRHFGDFPKLVQAHFPSGQVICLDLPGFGTQKNYRSPILISQIVNHVEMQFNEVKKNNSEPWAIFGISLGGMVALNWLGNKDCPFVIGIIANSSANLPLRIPAFDRISKEGIATLAKILRTQIPNQIELSVMQLVSNRGIDRKVLEKWTHWYLENPISTKNFLFQLIAAATFVAPIKLFRPAIFLASKKDRMVNWHCSERLFNYYQAPLAIHATAGHDLILDDPQWVVNQMVLAEKTYVV